MREKEDDMLKERTIDAGHYTIRLDPSTEPGTRARDPGAAVCVDVEAREVRFRPGVYASADEGAWESAAHQVVCFDIFADKCPKKDQEWLAEECARQGFPAMLPKDADVGAEVRGLAVRLGELLSEHCREHVREEEAEERRANERVLDMGGYRLVVDPASDAVLPEREALAVEGGCVCFRPYAVVEGYWPSFDALAEMAEQGMPEQDRKELRKRLGKQGFAGLLPDASPEAAEAELGRLLDTMSRLVAEESRRLSEAIGMIMERERSGWA